MSVLDVEDQLYEAASYDRKAPRVRGGGYNAFWPPMMYDPVDWGYQTLLLISATTGFGHAAPRRDTWDRVMLRWLGRDSPLTIAEKKLVWSRVGSGVPLSWRKVANLVGKSHEKCRNDYTICLIKLDKWAVEKNDLT